jgi:hypothetical protein
MSKVRLALGYRTLVHGSDTLGWNALRLHMLRQEALKAIPGAQIDSDCTLVKEEKEEEWTVLLTLHVDKESQEQVARFYGEHGPLLYKEENEVVDKLFPAYAKLREAGLSSAEAFAECSK